MWLSKGRKKIEMKKERLIEVKVEIIIFSELL